MRSNQSSKRAAVQAAIAFSVEALESRQLLSGSISGTVFSDPNANNTMLPGSGIAGAQVYLDLQGIDKYVAGDPVATTDANGNYAFTNLAAGNYLVRPVPVAGKVITAPVYGGKYFVQLGANQVVAGDTFGIKTVNTPSFTVNGQLLVSGTSGNQPTLTRYNADESTDVYFGSLGVVKLPASVSGQPTGATAQGSNTVVTYPSQTVTLDNSGNIVSITNTGNSGDILSNPPTNLTAAATSPRSVNITFSDNATNEDSYEIERAASASGPYSVVDVQTGTTTTGTESFTDTSVVANTTYFYRVVGTKGTTGLSAYAGPVSVTTPNQATSGGTISGHLAGSDGFEQIYLDLQGVDKYVAGDPITTPDANGNYVFTGLAPGNYLVRVVPRDNFFTSVPVYGGKYFVQLGANQTVSGEDFTVIFPSAHPVFNVAGQFLVSDVASNGQETLTRYSADHSTDVQFGSLGVVTLPASVQGDPTSATAQPNGNTVVTYPNATVTLGPSGAILSITTTGQTINAPTNLTASPSSSTSVQLGFTDNSTNDNGFIIQRATNASGPFTNIGSVPGSVTGPSTGFVGFADNSASPSTTYFYRVYAVNGSTQSAYAGPVSATTPAGASMGSSISGTVFDDTNFDGVQNNGETAVAGRQVYLDLQGIGVFANGDPITTTDANGLYSFANLQPGNYLVRLIPQSGKVVSAPVYGGKYFVQLGQNQGVTGDNFGTYTYDPADPTFTQADGKLLVGDYKGYTTMTSADAILRRFNPDGSVDTTFGRLGAVDLTPTAGTYTNAKVSFIAAKADGSIYVGYYTVSGQGQFTDYSVALLDSSGHVLKTDLFGSGNVYSHFDIAKSIQLLPSGKVLVVGQHTAFGTGQDTVNPARPILKQYNSDLSPDATFGVQGYADADSSFPASTKNIFGTPTAVTAQSDGSIMLTFPNDTVKITSTGQLDPARVIPTPTGLTATATSPTQVTLQFNDNATNELLYNIEASTAGTVDSFKVDGTLAGTTTTGLRTFVVTDAKPGVANYYRVRGLNGAVDSDVSSVVVVNTPAS
jgi:uncharacterized delta-60 repeat protein